jgi:type II secretory pathway pseudopilin PulG
MRQMRDNSGFALMDVMIAMVIVGIAIAAIVQLFYAGTTVNGEATRLTVAANLAQNIHEYALTLPHRGLNGRVGRTHGEVPPNCDDIADLDQWTFKPAVDSKCRPLADFPEWSQVVRVEGVSLTGMSSATTQPVNGALPKRLIVSVLYRDKPVHVEQWILAPTLN